MSAIQPFHYWIGTSPIQFSKEENILLEAALFTRVCKELKENFRHAHRNYFRLMKFTQEMENTMLENNFLRLIVTDILSSEEYTLEGIARYTNTHEDILQEIIIGKNNDPSASTFRRLIALHQSVRRELYHDIMKKIYHTSSVA